MLTSQSHQELLRVANSQVCLQEALCLKMGSGEIDGKLESWSSW